MRHPSEGVLRRLLDEPAAVAASDRDHAATCSRCHAELAGMRNDADLVGAFFPQVGEPDIDNGWRRLSSATASGRRSPLGVAHLGGRVRNLIRRPVVAGVAVAAVLAGAGTAAANDWFQIFETEKIAPVAFSASDLNALPDLRSYGDVSLDGQPDVRRVTDAATAGEETGLDVPEVTRLPRGVVGDPVYQVGNEMAVTFTFSAVRAAQAAAAAGERLPTPPPGMDGSEVRLVAGPGVAQVWRSQSSGVPALVVGRALAPRAFSSSGVPFEAMRAYLLSLPGLPRQVAATLRTFNADDSTLPLPIPAGRVTTSSAQVAGEPATVLASRDATMAAVAWVDDGVLTVVAGSLGADEVLSVARGLR